MMKETSYELLKDDQMKQLDKNNKSKMILYNALPQAKDLATLPLNELIGNLKVYEMILENDGVSSKTTKEKVKSLALKAKVTREQTSDDSDSQEGKMAAINSEEAVEVVLKTNEVKAQDKGEVATIAAKKATSLVSVQSPKKTRPLIEELRVIVKTVMNLKTMQHVSWQSTLKRASTLGEQMFPFFTRS
nr:zf-CCHC domain-containing protein/UBN2 domain-containing protein [Tanacetum cinerariifolium]